MDEQQQSMRTNIALGVIILMMMVFMWWTGGFSSAPAAQDAGTVALVDGGVAPTAETKAVMELTAADGGAQLALFADGGADAVAQREEPALAVVEVLRDRPTVHFTFSSQGAGLTAAVLQGPKMREQQQLSIAEGFKRLFGGGVKESPQMNAAQPVPASTLPLGLTVLGANGGALVPGDLRYAVEGEPGDKEATSVGFKGKANGVEVTKKFQWQKEGYELRYTVEIKNVSGQPLGGEYGLEYNRAVDPRFEEAPSMFGGVGNQSKSGCMAVDSYNALPPKDDDKTEEYKGPIHFIAIDQQYFVSAIYPLKGAKEGRCINASSPSVRRAVAYFPLSLQPGQSITEEFGVFIGPKDVDLLKSIPGSAAGINAPNPSSFRPQLEKTVDFGIWAVLCNVLLWILKFFHTVFGNWGVAVIMLTVVVKLALVPLTHKSMVAAENMKKLQPKMEEIRKKYAEDRERQNMEMMKLYQEAKVNPVGGCLPLLLQMPVWIALFTTLRNSYEIYQEPFFAPFITDLTYKDPTYLLPLLLGVTMIITQKLQPQMMDATQAKIMTWFMPILFTFMMLQYPAGLTLYIFTNNVLSIVQQWALKKWIARNPPPAPA